MEHTGGQRGIATRFRMGDADRTGLTQRSLRHIHKTVMEETGTAQIRHQRLPEATRCTAAGIASKEARLL
jgi:hypothetical protein